LKLSNAEGDRLAAWAGQDLNPRTLVGHSKEELAAALYPHKLGAALDRARLAWAFDAADPRVRDEVNHENWRALIDFMETWDRPALPVTGEDVIAAGVPKGPPVGAALKALEALWVRGGFKADKAQLLAALPMLRL
ncbi:MAG: hypothetical protein PVI23_07785, partial [Maricaulaceae bacterium]